MPTTHSDLVASLVGDMDSEPNDRVLLEGPHSRRRELWMLLRVLRDFLIGFRTLLQTGKIRNFPVVLIGRSYWQSLIDLLHQMVAAGTVNEADLRLFLATDDVSDALGHIERFAVQPFGLVRRDVPRPSRLLGERGTIVSSVEARS